LCSLEAQIGLGKRNIFRESDYFQLFPSNKPAPGAHLARFRLGGLDWRLRQNSFYMEIQNQIQDDRYGQQGKRKKGKPVDLVADALQILN
jgi:hypothetical protein